MNLKWLHTHTGKDKLLAYRIKNFEDEEARKIVAEEMAKEMSLNSVIVPMSSSSGINPAMLHLAWEIQKIKSNVRVIEAVKRIKPVDSSYKRRLAGKKPVSVNEHVESMELIYDFLDNNITVIDNTITSGNSLKAIEQVIGQDIDAIVYTNASRGRINPLENIEVLCISGSRNFISLEKIEDFIKSLSKTITIIHGGARGVDSFVEKIANRLRIKTIIYEAKWEEYGKAAGMIRNKRMINECDMLIAFWDGKSKGTKGTIEAAEKMGIPYEVIMDEK